MTVMEYGKQNHAAAVLLPGLRHGDLSLNDPERYARMVEEWI